MPDAELTAKPLTAAQSQDFLSVVWHAFLTELRPEDRDAWLTILEPGRAHGVFDGQTMIGGGAILSRSMTFPGVGPVPIAAVTAVGVAADQRRRGALTLLMRAQLHGLHHDGAEPVAVLWSSEGGIYGRFGYGLASRTAEVAVPKAAPFHPAVDAGTDRVALLSADAAQSALRKLHGEYVSARIGGLSRPEPVWEWRLADPEHERHGASPLRYAVHPAGYAIFRVKQDWQQRGPRHTVQVKELVSLTPHAHAALWQFLIRLDLVGEVKYDNAPMDEPLPFMLHDPRQATVQLSDGLYVRLVDLDRALQARRYAAPLNVVLEVSDELCPWNAGRWRLTIDDHGVAALRRTEDQADLACGAAELGAAYLGSTRLSVLGAAGRVRELRPGTLHQATIAFAAEHEPHCLEVF
jgi:predicted acetyltransferase